MAGADYRAAAGDAQLRVGRAGADGAGGGACRRGGRGRGNPSRWRCRTPPGRRSPAARRRGTVADVAPGTGPALTAAFIDMPAEHDGKRLFSFELRFSEDFPGRLRYKLLRDEAFQVTNGRVRIARRMAQGQNQRWDDLGAAGRARGRGGDGCRRRRTARYPAAVCTEAGPQAVEHGDARWCRVRRCSRWRTRGRARVVDAAVEFPRSRLSRPASGEVTVEYATARAARRPRARTTRAVARHAGPLPLARPVKTVSVPVLDDGHDEGEERFRLKLVGTRTERLDRRPTRRWAPS